MTMKTNREEKLVFLNKFKGAMKTVSYGLKSFNRSIYTSIKAFTAVRQQKE